MEFSSIFWTLHARAFACCACFPTAGDGLFVGPQCSPGSAAPQEFTRKARNGPGVLARVGLLGGTFNPIHMGHLWIAREAQAAFSLDEVLFVPNQIPPHRRQETGLASARDRYVMVSLATAGNPQFRPCPIEIDGDEVSYTVSTLERLRSERPDDEFTFVTGADSIIRYPWHRLDDVLGLLRRFVVVGRPGYDFDTLNNKVASYQLAHADRIAPLTVPLIEVSSTEIRRRVGNGEKITYMVPAAVEEYVMKMGLYS